MPNFSIFPLWVQKNLFGAGRKVPGSFYYNTIQFLTHPMQLTMESNQPWLGFKPVAGQPLTQKKVNPLLVH